MRARPTTMPTTTIVTSCEAATVRPETVLPVTRLSNTEKDEKGWLPAPCSYSPSVSVTKMLRLYSVSAVRLPTFKSMTLMLPNLDHPHLEAAGCQRQVALTDDHTLRLLHNLVMQLA